MNIRHLGSVIIAVSNMEKSIHFYHDVIGLPIKEKRANWVELVKDGDGDSTYSSLADRNNFREYLYKLPTSTLTGENEEFQYTNSRALNLQDLSIIQ